MGYNTAVLILNDGLDQLEKDPDAGVKIAKAVREHMGWAVNGTVHSVAIGNHANPVQIISSAHADTDQLVMIGQNLGRNLNVSVNRQPGDLKAIADVLTSAGWICTPPET